MTPVLDIRTYRLVPGGQADFDRILREDALPMLERFGIRVVAAGASADDAGLYYLIRAFASTDERNEQLGSFYGSEEWRRDHRDTVLGLVEAYHVALVEFTPELRAGLTALANRSGLHEG